MSDSGNNNNDQQIALVQAKNEMAMMKQQLEMALELEKLKSSMQLMMKDSELERQKEKNEDLKKFHAEKLELVTQVAKLEAKISQNPANAINGAHFLHHVSFEGSNILHAGQKQTLVSWMPGNWKLIYRASTNGASSATFHSCCDNRGPTFVVVRVGSNVFGGYAAMSWNSKNNYINAPGSFLFTLNNSSGDQPTILALRNNGNAIYSNTSYGPTFGNAHDLHISNGCTGNNTSYCNITGSHGYLNTLGRGVATFTGAKNFTVNDYEVFSQ